MTRKEKPWVDQRDFVKKTLFGKDISRMGLVPVTIPNRGAPHVRNVDDQSGGTAWGREKDNVFSGGGTEGGEKG